MWFDIYGHQTRQNTKKPQQNHFYCGFVVVSPGPILSYTEMKERLGILHNSLIFK